jgi:hypothetical protein
MSTLKKHIAGSGASAGNWVACTAAQCTLTSAQYHTDAAELVQVQQYVKDKTGEKVTSERLPLASVLEYKLLSDSSKKDIETKVEARKEEARLKKANKTKQPGTLLNEAREEAFAAYEQDNNKAKFHKAYLAAYSNLVKLPDADLEKVFNHVEKSNASGGVISSSKTGNGSTLSLAETAKTYKKLNSQPAAIRGITHPQPATTPFNTAANEAFIKKTREDLVRKAKRIPTTARIETLIARGSMKNDIKDSFEQLKRRGCTVSYDETKKFTSTTYNNIKVTGPASVVSIWKTWLKNNQ